MLLRMRLFLHACREAGKPLLQQLQQRLPITAELSALLAQDPTVRNVRCLLLLVPYRRVTVARTVETGHLRMHAGSAALPPVPTGLVGSGDLDWYFEVTKLPGAAHTAAAVAAACSLYLSRDAERPGSSESISLLLPLLQQRCWRS